MADKLNMILVVQLYLNNKTYFVDKSAAINMAAQLTTINMVEEFTSYRC